MGIESTVVSVVDGKVRLLRPGTITRQDLEAVCSTVESTKSERVLAPGMLASHYAPDSAVRLNAKGPRDGEALLAFGPDLPDHAGPAENLSSTSDLVEAAANLFAMLRRLDAQNPDGIAVMPVPVGGIGEAINDRLKRAAAPRS
ncbi:MAG: Sua5 family C-terminal domain-containing protein [Candidatus Phaeomarinobacter sp.]